MTSHFMIQSIQLVLSTAELPNLFESNLAGGLCEGKRSEPDQSKAER